MGLESSFRNFQSEFWGQYSLYQGHILANMKNRRANSQQSHRIAFKVFLFVKILVSNFIFTLLRDISILLSLALGNVLACSYLPLV